MREATRRGSGGFAAAGHHRRAPWALVSATLLAVAVVLPVGSVVFAPAASAAGNGLFAMSPASSPGAPPPQWLSPVLSPGVPSHDAFDLANLTKNTLDLNLYAADAITNTTGAFDVEPSYAPKKHMGAWIHLPVTTVSLPPLTGEKITFTYDPPPNVPPGDYPGGIVAVETTGSITKRGAVRVRSVQALGVAVYGRVPGPLHPSLVVTNVSLKTTSPLVSQFGGPVDVTVNYSVTNTGNESLTPIVTLSLSPLIGSGPRGRVKMHQILPGSTVDLTHTFDTVIPFGAVSATVTVHAAHASATGSSSAIVIPWGLVAIVVVLIVLIVLYVRRRRRSRPEAGGGPAQPGGTPSGPERVTRPQPVETGSSARGP